MKLIPLYEIRAQQLLKMLERRGDIEAVIGDGRHQGVLRKSPFYTGNYDNGIFLLSNDPHMNGGWDRELYDTLFKGYDYKYAFLITYSPWAYESCQRKILLKTERFTLFDLL